MHRRMEHIQLYYIMQLILEVSMVNGYSMVKTNLCSSADAPIMITTAGAHSLATFEFLQHLENVVYNLKVLGI